MLKSDTAKQAKVVEAGSSVQNRVWKEPGVVMPMDCLRRAADLSACPASHSPDILQYHGRAANDNNSTYDEDLTATILHFVKRRFQYISSIVFKRTVRRYSAL